MSARSAFETLFLALFCAAAGGVAVWFYRDAKAAETVSAALGDEVTLLSEQASAIAKDAAAISSATAKQRGLQHAIEQLAPTLESLATCPLPADVAGVLTAQDRAVNEANRSTGRSTGAQSDAMPSSGGD